MRFAKSKLLPGLAVCLFAVSLANTAFGYVFIVGPNGNPTIWDAGTTTVQLKLGSSTTLSDGTNYNSSVQAALTGWNSYLNSFQIASQTGSVGTASQANGVNEIAFGSNIYGSAFDYYTLAVTVSLRSSVARDDGTNRRTESDIIFNSNKSWDSYRGSQHAGSYDILRVAYHELGHVLGLDHPDQVWPYQYVSAIMNSTISDLDHLTDDDISGGRALYGTPGIGMMPLLTGSPTSATVNPGETAQFTVNASGNPAPNFQWQRQPVNGVWANLADAGNYTGVTSKTLSVSNASANMNGDQFRCVASNSAGSATTSSAQLTVREAPSISGLPASVSLAYGDYLSLYASVTGTSPVSYQWKKNGTAIPNATWYWYTKSQVTSDDAGSYTLTATNGAGTVVSSAVIVSVAAVVPPSITTQPSGVSVARGFSFALQVQATGSPTLRYQWYLNGTPIQYATSNYYSVNNAAASHGGTYTVTVTNDGGTVTSNPVEVLVLPATLPVINWMSGTTTISENSSLSINPNITGSPIMTYQWFKDGVAIPGATYSSYYKSGVTAADAGSYTVQVANDAGIAMSAELIVIWSSTGTSWVDSARYGDTVYFLGASPARIMRYNLSTDSWQAIVYLGETRVPTAFAVTAEGIFIAYNKELVRRSLAVDSETSVATSTLAIQRLVSGGNWVFFAEGSTVRSYNRQTLAAGATSSVFWSDYAFNSWNRPVVSSDAKVYSTRAGTSPNDILEFAVGSDGSISFTKDTPYHGDFRVGNRQYISPDESLIFDRSGVIYARPDLTYQGSLGTAFDDLSFLPDGRPVVLRGKTLVLYSGVNYSRSGEYRLNTVGYASYTRESATYVFGAPTTDGDNPAVTKVLANAFSAPDTPSTPSPVNKQFSVDDVSMDTGGIIYITSRSLRGVVRWDANGRHFLSSLPMRGSPAFISYARVVNRLVMSYSDGTLTQYQLNSDTSEHAFGNFSAYNSPMSLVAMDDLTFLNIHEADVSADLRLILGPQGDKRYLSTWNYYRPASSWCASTRRLYSVGSSYYDGTGEYLTVPSSGVIPTTPDSGTAQNVALPLRPNEEGTLILGGNGKVLNADLQQVGSLPNSVVDGAWTSTNFFTIRAHPQGTQVQKWARVTYSAAGSVSVSGLPLRVFRLSDTKIVVVTLVDGYVAFHIIGSDLVVASSSVNNRARSLGVGTDFNNDGYSDVLWRNSHTGDVGLWLMNGSSVGSYVSLPSVGLALSIVGIGDINNDGRPDILWWNGQARALGAWLMNGTSVGSYVDLGSGSAQLVPAGTGDFNGDGNLDILWRDQTSGQVSVWLMNGVTISSQVVIGNAPTNWTIAGTGDFTRDGNVDILWRRPNGEVGAWLMSGTSMTSYVTLGSVGMSWTISGTGDYNNDGKIDILWRDTGTGDVGAWLMDGTSVTSYAGFGSVGMEMTIAGSGETPHHLAPKVDFNLDGQTDILWRNTSTGAVGAWLMNGTTVSSYVELGTVGMSWSIAGTGDIDDDGQADIIWRDTLTGEIGAWLMNGTSVASYVSLGSVGNTWAIVGTGDYNADGETDLLWRNSATGEVGVWLINHNSVQYAPIGSVGQGWSIVGSADFNGDGKPDILWRNTNSGDVGVWFMNGTSITSYVPIGSVGPGWTIVGTGDFNGDGKPDILWRNTSTGDVGAWLMNGTAISSYQPIGSVGMTWTIHN